MHAHAQVQEEWEDDSAPASDPDHRRFEDNELLRAVVGFGGDNEPKTESFARELGTDQPSPRPVTPPRRCGRSKNELIAASERIRKECDELVRRYDAAVRSRMGARRPQRPLASRGRIAPSRPALASRDYHDAARRKKALLLMLIEELL